MTAKKQALKEIAEIAREHDLTAAEVLEQLSPSEEASDSKSSILTRLFGYLGGIFVLAGLGVFIEMQWEAMNSLARITVTLGSGIAAFVMALFAVGDERREKTATPLFLLAALLQPTGILVAIDEFSRGGDERHAILLDFGRPVDSADTDFSEDEAHRAAVHGSRFRGVPVRHRHGPRRCGRRLDRLHAGPCGLAGHLLDRPNRSRGDYTFLVLREFDRDVDGIVFPD